MEEKGNKTVLITGGAGYIFATLFGISPRTRFDLIINQFVLEALTKRKLIICQRGYTRSFVHVRDVCEAICLALEVSLEKVWGQVFNVGSDAGNYTKDEIVELVRRQADGTQVEQGAATQAEGLWWEYVTTVDPPAAQLRCW